MAMNIPAATNLAATRVWQNGNETDSQNKSAVSILYRVKVTGTNGTGGDEILTKADDVCEIRRKGGTTNDFQWLYLNSAGSGSVAELGTFTTGTWYTVILVYTAGAQTVYVNDSSVHTSSLAGNTWNEASRFQVGCPNGSAVDIHVDEFSIWTRALTGAEITSLSTDKRAADLADTSNLVHHFDFTQNTSGSVTNGDAGLNNLGSAGLDLVQKDGAPTWVDDDAFNVPAPVISVAVACGGLFAGDLTVASGSTLALGTIPKTWPDSTTATRIRLILTNSGTVDLTGTVVSASGDGTLISSGASHTIADGASEEIIVSLSTATTGSKSSTLTIASTELADHTITITWTVQEDTSRVVNEGAGFSTPPTESNTAVGSGISDRVCAQCDIKSYYWVEGPTLEVCVAADHSDIGWIEKIEVYFESDTVSKTIYTPTISTRTGAIGFTFTLTAATAGDKSFYVKAIPKNGKERQLGPITVTFDTDGSLTNSTIYVNASTGSDSNDGSTSLLAVQSIAKAVSLCSDADGGHIVECAAGTYDNHYDAGMTLRNPTRVNRIRPAAGLSYGDVIFSEVTRQTFTTRTRKLQIEDIKFDTKYLGRIETNTSDEQLIFLRCGFVDSNGVGGPLWGYASSGGVDTDPWFGSFALVASGAQISFYNTREVTGYTGLSGASLIAGGLDGNMLMPNHGGDNGFGTYAIFNMGFIESAQPAYLRIHKDQYLYATSVTYNGGTNRTTIVCTTTNEISESPYAEGTLQVRLFTNDTTDSGVAYDVYNDASALNNTTKTIIVDGDASSIALGTQRLCVTYQQHPDTSQFVFGATDGNWVYNRGYFICDRTEPQLPQYPSGTGAISAGWYQLCAWNGGSVGFWEENYTNCGFRSCTEIDCTLSLTGTVTRCAIIDSIFQDKPAFNALLNLHTIDGSASGYGQTAGTPDYDTDLVPTEGGNLTDRLYLPRLPYDVNGNAVPRDGTGPTGAFVVSATTPPPTWKAPRFESELVLGLYLFCGDGVGGASGNCGVATNVFGTEFEDFLTNGYNNPSTGDDALDNCIALGYEDVMLGWPFGLTASGSEYQIGTVAPGHPDEGDPIVSSPYDQKQFRALATSAATHISAIKTALIARADSLRAPIIYQGSPKYDQAITDSALDQTIQMAIDLDADVALDASGECTRASATLPVVALVTRLTGTHGLRYIAEAWGRDDVEDCREWLTLAASTIATGSDGTDTAYRADLAISDANNGWMKPEFIRSYGIRPIVLIAYNGNSTATRKGYIRFWLNMGCSVYFDPIGFTSADLTEIRQYFLSRRGGTFRKISTRQRD